MFFEPFGQSEGDAPAPDDHDPPDGVGVHVEVPERFRQVVVVGDEIDQVAGQKPVLPGRDDERLIPDDGEISGGGGL